MYIPRNVLQTRIGNPEDMLTSWVKTFTFSHACEKPAWTDPHLAPFGSVCRVHRWICSTSKKKKKNLADKENFSLIYTHKKWQLPCFWHDGWSKTRLFYAFFPLKPIFFPLQVKTPLTRESTDGVVYLHRTFNFCTFFIFFILSLTSPAFYQSKHCRLKAPGCEDLKWGAEPDLGTRVY